MVVISCRVVMPVLVSFRGSFSRLGYLLLSILYAFSRFMTVSSFIVVRYPHPKMHRSQGGKDEKLNRVST